jgi:hypothetical protein
VRLKRTALAVSAALLILLGLAAAAGVVFRGPVLRAVAGQVSKGLCGKLVVANGGVSWYAVPALLVGKPVHVWLDGVGLRAPSGESVFAAGQIRATVELRLRAKRIEVSGVEIERGHWVLASDGPGRTPGFTQATRSRPRDPEDFWRVCTGPALCRSRPRAVPRRRGGPPCRRFTSRTSTSPSR